MMITGGQQCQADNAQRLSPFFAVASLSQRRALVEAVDIGEKIGGIEQQLVHIDVEMAHHVRHDIAFDLDHGSAGDAVHIIPEALRGQLTGIDAQKPRQDG